MNSDEQHRLVQALLHRPLAFPHDVDRPRLVETHISQVLLTGPYAYKIKKPLNLGFLDFSTLERREFCCREELRLNRRLAPQIYLEVVPVTGGMDAPRLGGEGPALEYAVKMRQFRPELQLDRLLARGELSAAHMDVLAAEVARFHADIDRAGPDLPYGEPAHVHGPARANFTQMRPLVQAHAHRLEALAEWTEAAYDRLAPVLVARKANGFVRECHGDMHLANMFLDDGAVVIFDCIEFDPELRWIDVMSDVAFLVMDAADRGAPVLGQRFLNAYLELTGDWAGLAVLRYYLVYRALVRAKIAAIRATQPDLDTAGKAAAEADLDGYLNLAERYTRPEQPWLVITHGLSGSGKSTLATDLAGQAGAIRLRSDVERKRMFGLEADARTGSGLGQGIYAAAAGEATYAHLGALAEEALRDGYPVVVDATFLGKPQRDRFRDLAAACNVPFAILGCEACDQALRERVTQRQALRSDVSEAGVGVLEQQLATYQPLTAAEREFAVVVDTATRVDAGTTLTALRGKLGVP